MSWGYRIAILYGAFVLLIAALIMRSSKENVDLVTADYYDREIKFQDEIDGQAAVMNEGKEPTIVLDSTTVFVSIPNHGEQITDGMIEFYRPDNDELDKKYNMNGGALSVGRGQFVTGIYTVRMSWKEGTQQYNFESSIYLQ